MRENIDRCHNESESCTEYAEQSNTHFNNVVNITKNSDSITSQKKKMGESKIVRKTTRDNF